MLRPLFLVAVAAAPVFAQNAPLSPRACSPSRTAVSGPAWLARSAHALGMDVVGDSVLRITSVGVRLLTDQSDRPYAPYIVTAATDTVWYDPTTAVERVSVQLSGRGTYLRSPTATVRLNDSSSSPDPRMHSQLWSARAFNPWAVLGEWSERPSVRVSSECAYRDAKRVVLASAGALGEERLFLDERTAVPVKLERTESHYFLGPMRVEYVYATWSNAGTRAMAPLSVSRVVDGVPDESRSGVTAPPVLIARSAAPPMTMPASSSPMPVAPDARFPALPPDTVRVGANTFLLVSPVFTSVVSLQRDTVFVLDATAGETRAKQDEAWVRRLFPGQHHVAVVTLNHVWPHIAGVRYWVSRGATVIASETTAPFVSSVLRKRWTEIPDELEKRRSTARIRITTVHDTLSLAGGALRLYPLSGINGEGGLLAYVPAAQFVWASDHVQTIREPNIYVEDVRQTVERFGLSPRYTSGPHFRLIPWTDVEALARVGAPADRR